MQVIFKRAWSAPNGAFFRARAFPQEVDDGLRKALPSTATVVSEKEAADALEKKAKDDKSKAEPKALSQMKQEEILPKKD